MKLTRSKPFLPSKAYLVILHIPCHPASHTTLRIPCHPERSEEAGTPGAEILSAAKDDNPLAILVGKTHHRGGADLIY